MTDSTFANEVAGNVIMTIEAGQDECDPKPNHWDGFDFTSGDSDKIVRLAVEDRQWQVYVFTGPMILEASATFDNMKPHMIAAVIVEYLR